MPVQSKIANTVAVMAILSGQALSQPFIKFINECPYPLYVWPIGPTNSGV
jgi:hypothetical protein